MQKCKNYSHMYVYHCAQLSYTTQHRTILTIFPLILQTSTRAQMMFIWGKGEHAVSEVNGRCQILHLHPEYGYVVPLPRYSTIYVKNRKIFPPHYELQYRSLSLLIQPYQSWWTCRQSLINAVFSICYFPSILQMMTINMLQLGVKYTFLALICWGGTFSKLP